MGIAFLLGCAAPFTAPDGTEFKLYPGLHKQFLEPVWHFTLSDLLNSLQAEKLDAICVEISPSDYRRSLEGIYPPEAAAVSELFDQTISVIPADWRAPHREYKSQSAATKSLIANLKASFDKNLSQSPSRMQFALSAEGEAQIKEMHEAIIARDGQEADGFWVTRNEKIVENCLKASLDRHFHRIGIVFGVDHLYIIKSALVARGYRVSYGSLRATNDDLISSSVAQRWRQNLSALRDMRESSDSMVELIDDSGRIQDLEAFIQHAKKSPP